MKEELTSQNKKWGNQSSFVNDLVANVHQDNLSKIWHSR